MPSFFPDRYKMATIGASCSRKCFELYKEKRFAFLCTTTCERRNLHLQNQ